MKLNFVADKCIGCKLCQLACSAVHEGVFNPTKARLVVTSDYPPEGGLLIKAQYCDTCFICGTACPVGAITLEENRLTLNPEVCVGCGDCVAACPQQIIFLNAENQPNLCDFCGGTPQCVAWCPHGALEVSENA